jgi:ABC-type Fe3+-hydroxamate transport system substrate-binding protein
MRIDAHRSRRLRREAFWLLPFLLLAGISLALLRPWPEITRAASASRVIRDGSGKEISIPEPFPGVVSGWWTDDFLQKTHVIDAIAKVGAPDSRRKPRYDLLTRIFPRLAEDATLWDFPTDLESIVARDAGYVYLAGNEYFDYFGLLSVAAFPAENLDKDTVVFTGTRVWNDLIGRREEADDFMRRYIREHADMVSELRAHELASRPRALMLVSPSEDWTRCYGHGEFDARVALNNASEDYVALGRESDAERILAMNPELIVLAVGDYAGFIRDPRWRGLDAVRDRRVYENIAFNKYTFDIDGQPLAARWMAELAYPERLRPRMRELTRQHYRDSYGYELSEGEINELLGVAGNHDAAGYARFMRAEKHTQGGVNDD